jgi:hypothetical protein
VRNTFVFEVEPFDPRAAAKEGCSGSCGCSKRNGNQSFENELYQPNPGERLDHFSGPEHSQIGDRAVGKIPTTIVYDDKGSTLTYGEMISLAGDYFGHIFEMKNLARTPAGREQIRYARWKAVYQKTSPAPQVSAATPKAVVEREYKLAAVNHSHFSAGGHGRQAYSGYHTKALDLAFAAGQKSDQNMWREALTFEAFGNHFLTDIFSAGHVRTPRHEISQWYRQHYGDSLKKFIKYVADQLYRTMNQNKTLKWYEKLAETLFGEVRSQARGSIAKLGGEAINTFSLGDIISLALHDLDNCGLSVVSELDPTGNRVAGGYKWIAVGDSHLNTLGQECSRKPVPRNADTSIVRDMVNNAVKASIAELEKVRDAGKQNAGRNISLVEKALIIRKTLKAGIGLGYYAAFGYVPREDKSSKDLRLPINENDPAPLQWRWGKLGHALYWEVDAAVKGEIANRLAGRLADVPGQRERDALGAFVKLLQREGIKILQRAVERPAIQRARAARTP